MRRRWFRTLMIRYEPRPHRPALQCSATFLASAIGPDGGWGVAPRIRSLETQEDSNVGRVSSIVSVWCGMA
ncbi:hypothetical protein TNCV_3127301 [Trichonephila clavipes]|nr:hypothetical protein TNCV_3127301 [Trichonephila clavipes]